MNLLSRLRFLSVFAGPTRTLGAVVLVFGSSCLAHAEPSLPQLEKWLKRFPEADADGDGKLSVAEAMAYRKATKAQRAGNSRPEGSKRSFTPDPGWKEPRFPDHAVSYRSPEEIKEIYGDTFPDLPKTEDGVLRIVGTGHSFMAPGYKTLPLITQAAGFTQPLFTHTGGGMTGSTRYKWEQENGIFTFDRRPTPKLLAAISNAGWDRMMWGPYFQDEPEYYSCWIDFCLKYHPEMTFYLSDAWIQLYQLGGEFPESESYFTPEVIEAMHAEREGGYHELLEGLNETYPGKVFILPTARAMTIAAKQYVTEGLPGIEGFHKAIGGKDRSLWRDPLGHLGPGFDRLEGYFFYATLYGKSPELIETEIAFAEKDPEFPSDALDKIFRQIAWQAVTEHPLSGVKDDNGDGIAD
ncbi:MAG: hypothetical protein AAF191_16665 [Verrucomicrobiota bacterium]